MEEERSDWDKNGRIYASDLGTSLEDGGCALQFRKKCENEERETRGPGMLLMTRMGDLIHSDIPWLLKEALQGSGWELLEVEDRARYEVDGEEIGGRLDLLLRDPDGRLVVIDIKTKRGNAFQYLHEPKPGDVLQVQGYLKAKDAAYGGILYIDREGQNFMRLFWVDRDDAAVEKAVRTLQHFRDGPEPAPLGLRVRRRENKGPDSIYLDVPWQIKWCDLKQCACAAALPALPPDGIVAKLHPTDEGTTKIKLTNDGAPFARLIYNLLTETYPDEEFV